MYFDPFVLPFSIGLFLLLLYLVINYTKWLKTFSKTERNQIKHKLISYSTLKSIYEIFMESLVHHRIFKINGFLGYMHMCFGLGWFLLIIIGKIESVIYHPSLLNPPYYAIFFRFFHPAQETFPYYKEFTFAMDLILLFILSGLTLAVIKRLYSKFFGMKRTTKHRPYDLLVLSVLWSIFPLRFLAESFTSGARGGGSFLTNTAGRFFNDFLPLDNLIYPAWWLYSISLGAFFVLIPWSRYMHIPTEIIYIFLKNWGIKQGQKLSGFTKFQLYSCSRCGICISQCQLGTSLGMTETQPVYFLKNIRHHKDYSIQTENCLMCGRCEESCPVNLELNSIRLACREDHSYADSHTYDFIKPDVAQNFKYNKVAYFAGCMGHLTPTVIKSMLKILNKAGVDYEFLDKDGGMCCGRPLLLSGNKNIADVLIDKNIEKIKASGAGILVTSCPICYKTFRENYNLNIKVMHHSEYIDLLIKNGSIKPIKNNISTVFHSPCELGRGCNVVEQPLNVLENVSNLIRTKYDGKKSLCCGGSLANTHISHIERTKLASDAVKVYAAYKPDTIVTACPLCKKTFSKVSSQIMDIAEIVAKTI